MLAAIRRGLDNLLNFSGRDPRQTFWYYVLFVYLVTTAINVVVMVPMMISGFVKAVQQGIAAADAGNPAAAQMLTQSGMATAMGDMMHAMTWMVMVTGMLNIVLLGAAFVRRLHDSNLSALWALILGAAQIIYLFIVPDLMSGAMERMTQNMTQGPSSNPMAGIQAMQASMTGASLLGWASTIIIVVLAVRKSTPGPNRYGEAPFTA